MIQGHHKKNIYIYIYYIYMYIHLKICTEYVSTCVNYIYIYFVVHRYIHLHFILTYFIGIFCRHTDAKNRHCLPYGRPRNPGKIPD